MTVETAAAAPVADPPATTSAWWVRHYTFFGTGFGLLFIWLSMTPSLLPRGPLFQGLVSGAAGAIGYLLGVFGVWLVRYMRSKETSPPAPLWAWKTLIVVGILGQIAAIVWFHMWQDDVRDLFGVPPAVLPEVRPSSGPFGTAGAEFFGAAIPPAELDLEHIDETAARLPVRVVFEGTRPRLGAAGKGAKAGLARLLVAMTDAEADGSWTRLKVCLADECQWAFFDTSRNRAGRWCSMAECGNKVKMRRAYARRRP